VLKDVILRHRKFIAEAFPPTYTPPPGACTTRLDRIWIATDKQQNIWLAEDKQVSVLSGSRWIDLVETLQRHGWQAPACRFLSPLGDGRSVFLSDDDTMRGQSLIATLQEGRGGVTPGPREGVDTDIQRIREPDGSLWIEGNVDNGPFAAPANYRVFHLRGPGKPHEVLNEGIPRLVDQSGNVWLVRDNSTAQIIRFAICQDGKIDHRLEIPGTRELYALFSDQPGSVYAWTARGLHHLVNADEKGYQLEHTHALPTLPANTPWAYSSRLGLVVQEYGQEQKLHFVTLPGK
jgi:hypothetical protein